MLKAYSLVKRIDEKACQIIRDAGIQLEFWNYEETPSKEQIIEILNNYDILIISVKHKLTKDILDTIKEKKIIATLSNGIDHIDKSFYESDLIKIINSPKANAISVAEHIFALILALKKRIIEANDTSINGGTKKDMSKRSSEINGSILGIIGSGTISREVIKIAKAFNMEIYCNTIDLENSQDLLNESVEFVNLEFLLSKSDIITVNIPLNEETRNLISKDKIKLMKKNATFINTARAEITDVNELIKYADENDTFNVGLDIDTENYKEIIHSKRNNVIVTPHTAGVTEESIGRMDIEVANNIKKYLGLE